MRISFLRKNSKNGYTLMELLATIVVVAILVTIAFPVFRKTIEKSREKIATTNLKLILAGENLYRLSHDHYYVPGEEDFLSNINDNLNLDIEAKNFTYKMETTGAYTFEVRAFDADGEEVACIAQDGQSCGPAE